MKFVQVQPITRGSFKEESSRSLTYISEVPVKVGDIVVGQVYASPQYHRVLKVGTTRAAVGSSYGGALKVIDRVLTPREQKAYDRVQRAELARDRAYSALAEASAAAQKEAR